MTVRREEQEEFLRKTGAFFWFPGLTERRYFWIRILAGIFLGNIGAVAAELFLEKTAVIWLSAAAAGISGYWLPGGAFRLSDSRDNLRMTADIRRLYEYVRIQTKAGMYLTNILSVCYLATANRRLKQALLEMNGKIVATSDITAAVQEFGKKFNNEYIDQFCVIILQAGQSGRMTKMLGDITEQITEMERQLLARRRNQMERRVLALSLLIFSVIILTALYLLGISFYDSISGILM